MKVTLHTVPHCMCMECILRACMRMCARVCVCARARSLCTVAWRAGRGLGWVLQPPRRATSGASASERLHRVGLCHCSVTPQHVLIDFEGQAVLGGLGHTRYIARPTTKPLICHLFVISHAAADVRLYLACATSCGLTLYGMAWRVVERSWCVCCMRRKQQPWCGPHSLQEINFVAHRAAFRRTTWKTRSRLWKAHCFVPSSESPLIRQGQSFMA